MLESLQHPDVNGTNLFPQETLGNTLITIDHPKFLEGYLAGYTNYTQVGSYLPHSGTMLRDVLLARCTSQPNQPGAATLPSTPSSNACPERGQSNCATCLSRTRRCNRWTSLA